MNQIDPRGKRYASYGARNATLTGNQWTAGPTARITCDMDPKWRKERKYERLFFLDEATALAAGHRPCFRCRRKAYNSFKAAWSAAGFEAPSIKAVDDAIHRQQGRTHRAPAATLPTGTMIEAGNDLFVVANGAMQRWTPTGYEAGRPLPSGEVDVITPQAIVATLRSGYQPVLHPTAG